MFLRGKCRLWKKEKSKLQEWSLPSCSKHKLGEALSLLPPLWGTLLSSTQAAVGGLLQFLSLGDIQWATVQFPGNDSSYLNHIQVGDTLYHHWHGSWIEKKETSPELSYHWILNTQFGGAQTWGTVAENALSFSLAAAAVQVLWNVWYLGGSFRSRSNSTANLHWKQVFICLIVKILQPAKSSSL